MTDKNYQLIQALMGLKALGNVDLNNRPVVRNSDGSISTIKSMSFGNDQGEVLVPMVADEGRVMTPEETIKRYNLTGKHLGVFDDPESATAYGEILHRAQKDQYRR